MDLKWIKIMTEYMYMWYSGYIIKIVLILHMYVPLK